MSLWFSVSMELSWVLANDMAVHSDIEGVSQTIDWLLTGDFIQCLKALCLRDFKLSWTTKTQVYFSG